jgi:DNA invertase Pin-like site-specific DNA recombinase
MKIGYARVSTDEQTLALQLDALNGAKCDQIFQDDGLSSMAAKRPGLAAALDALQDGDVLTVWRIDRLGRSTAQLTLLLDDLRKRGVGFHSIMDGLDTTTATGRAAFGIIAVMAQLERELIVERTRAGMAAARRRGKRLGRPAKLKPEQLDYAAERIAAGEGRAVVARKLGVDPSTLRRLMRPAVSAMPSQRKPVSAYRT